MGCDDGSDDGSDGDSVGGSPSLFEGATGFSGRLADVAGPGEAISGDCVGVFFPGFPVFAGAAGSLGRDSGFATSMEDLACSGTDVGSVGAGAGLEAGRGSEVGSNNGAGVKANGGSRRSKELMKFGSMFMPVHIAAHVGLRENISVGGWINGSHGGPTVV